MAARTVLPAGSVAALDQPTRRALFQLITSSEDAVSRDQAARSLGLSRSTAAFHLDALAATGLVTVEFRRLSGRSGPGAGRPAKLYRRSVSEVSVSVPPRRYELAAELFAAAIAESGRTGQHVRDVLRRLAADSGRTLGAHADTFEQALQNEGFDPREDPTGGLVMGNCPFHRLAQRHTELVCELNYSLVRGVAEGVPGCHRAVISDPGAGSCCVRAVER